jgi:hypothetical protein
VTATKSNEIVPTSLEKYPLHERCEVTVNFMCYVVYNMRMKIADCDIITVIPRLTSDPANDFSANEDFFAVSGLG